MLLHATPDKSVDKLHVLSQPNSFSCQRNRTRKLSNLEVKVGETES